jgi:nitrogen PTS system EIIA component
MMMDLTRAAYALNTSEETVRRWVRQGMIPATDQDGELLFDSRVLESWAERRKMPLRTAPPREREDRGTVHTGLADAMSRGGVLFDIPGADAEAVLTAAVTRGQLPSDIDKGMLLGRLLEREALASTGIGNGVAIPHPRHPVERVPCDGVVVTAFLESPIDFNAVDGEPVFVLFIMLSPNTRQHLHMLSRLTYCLNDRSFLESLGSCRQEPQFLGLVESAERRIRQDS